MHYLRDGWAPKVILFRPAFDAFHTLSDKARLMARMTGRMPLSYR